MKKASAALLVVIVAAVTGYYAFPEKVAGYMMDAARSKAGLIRKEIQIDDHKIVYLEGGKGATVLLLHGYAGNKDNWILFARYLSKDYHVVIPDIPGYGESSMIRAASYDLSSQMSRLHKFARAAGLTRFHIAGNSMGGLFAGTYAVRYPGEVVSLGLLNAGGVMPLEKNTVMKMMEKGENLLVLKDADDLTRLMELVFVKRPVLPYPIAKAMIDNHLTNREFYEKEMRELGPDFLSLEKDLPKIKAQTLILWGDQDKILDVSSVPVFEKGLKNRKTIIINDCGHAPMIEKPQETATHYIDFIKGTKI